MGKCHWNVNNKEFMAHLTANILDLCPYEEMSKEDLIECCKAHDAHHQEHHEREDKHDARVTELLAHSNKQLFEIRKLKKINKELVEQSIVKNAGHNMNPQEES